MYVYPTKTYARAFTLIELLATIMIVAVLGALLFPAYKTAMNSAKNTRCLANMRTVYGAMQAYKNDGGFWPSVNVNSESDPGAPGSQIWYVALIRLKYLTARIEKRNNQNVAIADALVCPSNMADPGAPYVYTSSPFPWTSNYAMNHEWGERTHAGVWSPRVPALAVSNGSAILLIDSTSKTGSVYLSSNVKWSAPNCAIPKIHNGGAHALLANGAVITVTPQSHPDIEDPKYWNPRL